MRAIIIMILILALIPTVSAVTDNSLIDLECQSYGYDFGIAKWEWNDGFGVYLETINSASNLITITGDQSQAFWTASEEVTGVISDEICYFQVTPGGTGGIVTVHDDSQLIQYITFCGDEVKKDNSGDECLVNCKEGDLEEVPEFGTLAALAILAGVGLYIYKKRN